MKIYLDGRFVDEAEARISAFDAGAQHGVGLFETMRAWGGCVYRLDEHLARLAASAAELGLTERLELEPLADAVRLTVQQNTLTEARIRLTLTGGNLALLGEAPGQSAGERKARHRPTVIIHATAPTDYPESFFTDGVMASIADPKANPFDPTAGHKTINYWARLQSLAKAAGLGAGEALWFTVTNHLCGGAVSNALLVKDDQLFTPIAHGEEAEGALPAPVRPGITRGAIMALAEGMGRPVQTRMLSINDVLEADELLLTNSSWGVLPVVRVERKAIGTGKPGPVTTALRQALSEDIRRRCEMD